MVPKPVLIKQLEAWHIEQRVEGGPEIAIVARVLLQRGVEHVVRHSSTHLVYLGIAQILGSLIRIYEHVVRMIEASIFATPRANE